MNDTVYSPTLAKLYLLVVLDELASGEFSRIKSHLKFVILSGKLRKKPLDRKTLFSYVANQVYLISLLRDKALELEKKCRIKAKSKEADHYRELAVLLQGKVYFSAQEIDWLVDLL